MNSKLLSTEYAPYDNVKMYIDTLHLELKTVSKNRTNIVIKYCYISRDNGYFYPIQLTSNWHDDSFLNHAHQSYFTYFR